MNGTVYKHPDWNIGNCRDHSGASQTPAYIKTESLAFNASIAGEQSGSVRFHRMGRSDLGVDDSKRRFQQPDSDSCGQRHNMYRGIFLFQTLLRCSIQAITEFCPTHLSSNYRWRLQTRSMVAMA